MFLLYELHQFHGFESILSTLYL